jgi:hypothetical protein
LVSKEFTMTGKGPDGSRARQVAAAVAVLFGLATLAAGGSVLAGRDAGYLVYRPLLIFNTVMGVGYLVAGIVAWGRAPLGRNAAAVILGLNLLVLGRVAFLYRTSTVVAIDSVRAMILRSAVWFALLLVFVRASRKSRGAAVS